MTWDFGFHLSFYKNIVYMDFWRLSLQLGIIIIMLFFYLVNKGLLVNVFTDSKENSALFIVSCIHSNSI